MAGNAAGDVEIIIRANTASYSQSLEKVIQQHRRLEVSSRETAHATVAPWQASSAALRVLEGNMTNNIRAAERFLGVIPGVGKALQGAFPVVGAIALTGVVAEMGKKFVDLIDSANRAPQAIQTAFYGLMTSQRLENDELQKTYDSLQNQLRALQGRPQDNLTPAVDNERLAVDRLVQSLMRANEQAKQLTKRNQISWLQELLTGKQSTGDIAGTVQYYQTALSNAAGALSDASSQYGPESPQAKAAKAALDRRRADAEQSMQGYIWRLAPSPNRAGNITGDTSAELAIARAYMGILQGQDRMESIQSGIAKVQPRVDALKHAKELQASQKQAAALWMEEQRQELEQRRASQDMTLADQANFWISRAAEERKGAREFAAAIDEANKLIAQQRAEHLRNADTWQKGNAGAFTLSRSDLSKDWGGWMGEQGRASASYLRSLNDAVAIQQKNARAYAELALQISVASGQMSRYDAVQVQAKMNAEQLDAQIAGIRSAMEAAGNDPTLTPNERAARLQQLRNQQMQTYGGFYASQMQLDAEQRSATSLGALREAADRLAQSFTDLPAHVQELFGSSVMGLNGAFAGAVMAPARTSWEWRRNMSNALGGEVRSIGARGLDSALQLGEGSLLHHFGFGRADGTQGNPFWVRSADLSAPGMNPLASLAAATDGRVTPGSAAGVISTGLQLATMIPGFAAGGTIPSNMPAIVGEHGPELLPPMSSPRTVIPNGEWSLGNHYHMPLTIDARGATDPAAVHAAIYRAVDGLRQQVPAIALAAHREYNRNRPGTSRL